MGTGSLHARPSCRRIALLVALGVTIGVAFTAPGRFAARPWLKPLPSKLDIRCPLWLESVMLTDADSRYRALYHAFRDAGVDGDEEAARAALAPTPQRVAERLAGIDGWSTAVLFEPGTSASSVRDAGLDDPTTCVLLTGGTTGLFQRGGPVTPTEPAGWSPLRSWCLVLLDAAGRKVGQIELHAARPQRMHLDTDGKPFFVPGAGAADDPALRAVCVFRRTDSGEIRTG